MRIFLYGIGIFLFSLLSHGSESVVFIADAGKITNNAAITLNSIDRSGIKSIVMAGDNLYSSTYEKVWKPWLDKGLKFDVTAIGNHNAGYAKEMAFFDMPAEYYSKTYGAEARFIVLNSDNTKTAVAQAAFLEQELVNAQEPFIFLVYHHPSYTLSHFHGWKEKQKFQEAIRPVIWRYRQKITSLLLGHDHLAMVAQYNDLPAFVSGSVQEARTDSPINNVQDGVQVKTLWFYDKKPYWTRITFDSGTLVATFDFIRANDDLVRCTATVVTGQPVRLQPNCRMNRKDEIDEIVGTTKKINSFAQGNTLTL